MTDEEMKLLDKMATAGGQAGYCADDYLASVMLSVVKANLGKIAKICPRCHGEIVRYNLDKDEVVTDACPDCQNGIVPKGK